MVEITIALPDDLHAWLEAQVRAGRYGDAAEMVSDLIRNEQTKAAKVAHLQWLVDEGRASGVSDRGIDEIFAEAHAEALAQSASTAAG